MSTLPLEPQQTATRKRVTAPSVKAMKGVEQIAMLTAYDYPAAFFLDECGVDVLLVGDSLAMVVYGEPNTLSITMDDMLRHTRAVSKAATRALVVGDMPFMSYQVSIEEAVRNAGRFLKEAGAHAVKLEGGTEMADTIRAITRAGIPVMAHIGLTPQSIQALGNYRMHGKSEVEQEYLLQSAAAVAEAGAFSVVLECVVPTLATRITKVIAIPTIGIGSGSGAATCDGQVLVTQDLLGLTAGRTPSFVQAEARLRDELQAAVARYVVRTKTAGIQGNA